MKKILIVGGGISGAATLHFLKQKYADSARVDIKLIEKNISLGGTIETSIIEDTYFESGPNGFLNNSPETFELIDALELHDQLIVADSASKKRYILHENKLCLVPRGPLSFLTFPLLSFREKGNIIKALFTPLKHTPQMTIAEFSEQNIGANFKKYMVDPMVSGIFGGDINKLNIKACFPRLANILDSGESFLSYRKKNPKKTKTVLYSFQKGMQTIITKIAEKYKADIVCNTQVESVCKEGEQFHIQTSTGVYTADQLILSTPAKPAAQLIKDLYPQLSNSLEQIPYAPIAVVGLKFKRKALSNFPQGFGVLIPSCEKSRVLGVLFESQIYPSRYQDNDLVMRVMLGGSHNQDIATSSKDDIIKCALDKLRESFSIDISPSAIFLKLWKNAIPQYTNAYVEHLEIINSQLEQYSNFQIVSNYYKGISFNDCIKNAKLCAEKMKL